MSLKEQLTGAIKTGDYIKVSDVLEQMDASAVNEKNGDGKTILHVALDPGNGQILARLLAKQGIDVNVKDNNGSTPLHSALWRNSHKAITQLLGTPGIDVNVKDGHGDSPLQVALELARLQDNALCITQLLASPGIDVNDKNETGMTPLHTACRENIHVTQLLACPSINVNVKTTFGMTSGVTPAMIAARFCSREILKRILEDPRVDLDVKDDDGWGLEEWCGLQGEKCLKLIGKEKLRRWKKNGKTLDTKRKELDERHMLEMERLVKTRKLGWKTRLTSREGMIKKLPQDL